MVNARSLLVALVTGLVLALVAAVLVELVSGPKYGHRINTEALPTEAKAILAERPGVPISSEQWRRLDMVMAKHGGWPGGGEVFAASVRHSWYWFAAFPLLALFLLHRRAALSFRVGALISAPSLVVVAYAFVCTPTAAML
jgi:hypothetical protein